MAGSLDDLVPVAEAGVGAESALLVPKTLDSLLELLDLSCGRGVVALRQRAPKLGAALGGPLDLGLDLFQCVHAS